MATDKSGDMPVTLDLDSLERGTDAGRPPFVVNVNGRKIALTDPQEADWIDLAAIEDDPVRFVGLCIEDDADRDHFYETRIEAWKVNKMIQAFMKHYGVTNRGNRGASPR